MLRRRFAFVPGYNYEGPDPAICCDGLLRGGALHLTHWQGNETPRAYKADTSTEIALNFVKARESVEHWSDALVINNHFDTDGILSVWVLLDPERAGPHHELLVAAAEAGDFDEWPRAERGLWLDASVRALAADAENDAAAYAVVLPRLPELIATLDDRRDLWGREWDDLQAAVAALHSGRLCAERHGDLGVLVHKPGQPEAPGALLARQFLPGTRCYLLGFEQGDGQFTYRYERPRYAWADTVVRPAVLQPDVGAVLAALGPDWTDEDLPGMTGIAHTQRPVALRPGEVITILSGGE
jgi:hypothetical protein